MRYLPGHRVRQINNIMIRFLPRCSGRYPYSLWINPKYNEDFLEEPFPNNLIENYECIGNFATEQESVDFCESCTIYLREK